MFLLLKFPSHTSVAVDGSLLNDRLIPITTSYRVVVVVVGHEGGGLIRSSNNPGDIENMEDYHDEATENPMYQTYTRVLHWKREHVCFKHSLNADLVLPRFARALIL